MKTKKLSPLPYDKAEQDSRQNRCLYSDPAGFFLTGCGFRNPGGVLPNFREKKEGDKTGFCWSCSLFS